MVTEKTRVARPRDYLEFKLTQLMADVVGKQFGPTDDFFDNGGTSLGALQFLHRVEQELGVSVASDEFLVAPDAEALALSISRGGAERGYPRSVVRVGPAGGPLHLYLIHGRGGEVYAYEPLRDAGLPATVRAVRAVGCDREAPPLPTFAAMADHYARLIADDCPTGPVMIGGFCLGAVIAMEVARRVQDGGRQIGRLLAFDAGPDGPSYSEADRDLMLAGRHPELEGLVKTGVPEDAFDLGRDSWSHITAVLAGLGKLAPGGDPDVIAARLRLVGQILIASAEYRPEPVSFPVTAIYTADYPEDELAAALAGWRALSPDVSRRRVTAEHERFFSSSETVEAIRHELVLNGA